MSERVFSTGTYVSVFATLLVLTGSTVVVAHLDLGPFSTPAALLIASTKALLVLSFFMHLRISDRLVWVFALAGFLCVGLLIGFTVIEVETRGGFTSEGSTDRPEVGDDRPGVLFGETEGGHRRAR